MLTHKEIKGFINRLLDHMEMRTPLLSDDKGIMGVFSKEDLFPVLYRGTKVGRETPSKTHAVSWTTNKEVAKDFSRNHRNYERAPQAVLIESNNIKGFSLTPLVNNLWEYIVDVDYTGNTNELIPLVERLIALDTEDEVVVFH